MISVGLFGAGRIGQIHADNVASRRDVELRYVVDVDQQAAEKLASRHGATVVSVETVIADESLHAVIIASPTDTHADLIARSARAGKAIFCEKPIDLDLANVDACLAVVAESGVPLAIGFNRRFDPSFAALHRRVQAGEVGEVETVTITSRDPAPPPVDYIRHSGGLFRDMMIHDFDMARWMLGEEPVQVHATASCLVDPAIGAAGDIDTAMVTLRTGSGKLCHIGNSRRAVYGYDQRIEVFGSKGMLLAGNQRTDTVERHAESGKTVAPVQDFFLERYRDAYRIELDEFVTAIDGGRAPAVGGEAGRRALLLADAAAASAASGEAVRV